MSYHEIEEADYFTARCQDCLWQKAVFTKYLPLIQEAYEHVEEHYSHTIEVSKTHLVGRNLGTY